MVPAIPGLCLYKQKDAWYFVAGNAFANMARTMAFHSHWGYGSDILESYRLLAAAPQLNSGFSTRAEALHALGECLNPQSHESTLVNLLHNHV